MKIVIFAGGSGRRLWPISRQKSPKQFEPILGQKSTLQLAVDRVEGIYGAENIFISTNERYVEMVQGQLEQLPAQNIIGEPTRRDLAAAVGLAFAHFGHAGTEENVHEPVAILWGDNYMDQVDNFRRTLQTAESLINNGTAKIIFMGETPRFPNDNLGWIGLGPKKGEAKGQPFYAFESLTYRPPLEVCRQMFAEKTHVWNTGYFVTTIGFIQALYAEKQPKMWSQLSEIAATIGLETYVDKLHAVYPTLDVLSFDDAILQYVDPEDALVLHSEMGWSDPGTLYALKEAIASEQAANVTKGLTLLQESSDCLVYNYEDEKLVTVVGLDGMVVVNTADALLVVHKDMIPLVKQLVNGLEGTELEKYS
jgi:mannose-1-phosphate guanylyltransferase